MLGEWYETEIYQIGYYRTGDEHSSRHPPKQMRPCSPREGRSSSSVTYSALDSRSSDDRIQVPLRFGIPIFATYTSHATLTNAGVY